MGCGYVMIDAIWQNIFLATLIVFLIAALIYMLGKLLKRDDYVAYSKTEFYNFIITFALIFSFVSVAAIAIELSCPAGTDANLFDQATARINILLYGEVYPTLHNLFQIMLESSALSNLTINYSKGAISFSPGAGFKYFYTSLNVLSFILETIFASLYIQAFLLVVLKETAFSIIFPVGIFLRAFPITRDAGAYLMALAFSLYTMFPYIYVVSLDTYDKILQEAQYENFFQNAVFPQGMFYRYSKLIEDSIFYVMSAANYASIREMFFNIGAYLFTAVSIPALAIILSVALTTSIIKFLKEVSA